MSILHPFTSHAPGRSPALPPDPVRAAAINGLRALADFLAEHPEFPIRRFEHARLQHSVRRANAADSIAEVNRLAAAMGVEATWNDNTYSAVMHFGSVIYTIFYAGEPEATEVAF